MQSKSSEYSYIKHQRGSLTMIRDQNGDLGLPGVEGQLRRVGENYYALF